MNVLLFIALAFPLGCAALICSLALLGIVMLARAPRGRRNQGEHGAKLAAILVGIRSAREAG
jgi:hypothetical protein